MAENELSLSKNQAYVSIIGSDNLPVTKTISWNGEQIIKSPGAQIYQGYAKTIEAPTPEALLEIIKHLKPTEALALGVLKSANIDQPLVTRQRQSAGTIARTKEFFQFHMGPGWLLLDIDAKDLPEQIISKICKKNLFDLILSLVPELKDSSYLVRPSSSAGIILPDGSEHVATGFHAWVMIEQATQAPQLLKDISNALWAKGFGFINLAGNGAMLERTLVDLGVASPERLIFEADPIVVPPLSRKNIDTVLSTGDPLTSVQNPPTEVIEKLIQSAKESVKSTSEEKKARHRKEQIAQISKLNKIDKTEAGKIYRQRNEGHLLLDRDTLELADGSIIRVDEFLDTNSKSVGLPCPIEGRSYGTSTAYFYPADANNTEAKIVSFAHGQRTFFYFERYKHLRTLKWLPETQRRIPNKEDTADNIGARLEAAVHQDLSNKVIPKTYGMSDGPNPQLLYRVNVGVGKTQIAIQAVREMIALGLRVAIRVPRIDLAEEWLHRLNQMAPGAAAVWRGREQENPTNPLKQMCPRHDVVREAMRHGIEPKSICGSKKQGYCAFHPDNPTCTSPCGYRQQDFSMHHAVIFASDKMLTLAPRSGMKRSENWRAYQGIKANASITRDEIQASRGDRPHFDCLVIDETDPLALIEIVEGHNALRLSEFEIQGDTPAHELVQMALNHFRSLLNVETKKSLSMIEEAPPELADLLEEWRKETIQKPSDDDRYFPAQIFPRHIDDDEIQSCGDALSALECIREDLLKIIPPPREANKAHQLSAAQLNNKNEDQIETRTALTKLVSFVDALLASHNQLSGHLKSVKRDQKEPGKIELKLLKPLSPHYTTIPTMVFDATATPELLRYTLPNIEMSYEGTAIDGPGVTRYQLRDSVVSYNTIRSDLWKDLISVFCELLARTYPSAGVILPKDVETKIEGVVSPNVILGHFGAITGTNSFEDVNALAVIGRQAVSPEFFEEQTSALTRQTVNNVGEQKWYGKASRQIFYRDGLRGWAVETDVHPDPLVEAARKSLTTASLEQALGRGRNVRRPQEKPLTEFVLTNIPTERLVDGTFSLNEFKAATGWIGALLSSGIWLQPGKGAEILYYILKAQRLDSLYNTLIETSAFESPEQSSNWLKQQLGQKGPTSSDINHRTNLTEAQATSALHLKITDALTNGAATVDLLCMPFPLRDFQPVKAKKKGSRYMAQLYIRTNPGQSPAASLKEFIEPWFSDIEIAPAI